MKFDIYTINTESLTIETINGKISSTKKSNIQKKGCRIFKNQKIYSGSYVGNIEDKDFVENINKISITGLDYEYELPTFKNLSQKDLNFDSYDIMNLKTEVDRVEEVIKKYFDKFIFTGSMKVKKTKLKISNHEDKSLKSHKLNFETYYLLKEVGSANIIDGHFHSEGASFGLLESFLRYEPYLQKFNTKAKIENGEHPIVFIDASSAWYSKLLESLKADKYFTGACLFSGKLGEKIFSEKFTLIDETYNQLTGIDVPFDDEGYIRKDRNLPLIENGVFKNIITDLKYANKFHLNPTGNGIRTYNSAAQIGFNNLAFKPGQNSFDSILKSLDKCIVSFMMSGGDFNDTGLFSTPIQLSFLVSNGEVIGRLPQLTLTTSIQKMFSENLIDFSSDSFYKTDSCVNMFHKVNIYNH